MQLSNISHWVCVVSGLLLMVTGLASGVPRSARLVARGQQPSDHAGLARQAILFAIGLLAVVYGVSRMIVL